MPFKVIAYDVGTTGLKTCMFDISAGKSVEYLAGEVSPYELVVLRNGGIEQNPEDWWKAMAVSTRRLLERTGTRKEEIQGITFCSQFQTVVMVDKAGRPLRMAMSCMDARADRQFRNVMCRGLKVEGLNLFHVLRYIRETGAASGSSKDPAWKYLWVRDNEPEVFKATYKWLDAKEYLTCRATGRMAATRDDACATFLYNVHKRDWSPGICRALGVDPGHLPPLCESTDEVGGLLPKAAEELGLAPGTPVYAGASDVSLCSVGAGCVDPGDALVYIGTSGWVATTVRKLHLDLGNLIAAIVGADPDSYVYIAEVETAGKCMEWVKDRIDQTRMDYDQMMAYARKSPPGANGVVFSPWMHGNRCPFDDANSRGAFFNLDIDTHGYDMMRAVIEGVCLHMRWLMDCTEEAVKTNPVVRFAGGSALSPFTCQIMADVLNRDVEVVANPRQVGAMGAAALAAVSVGILGHIRDIKKVIATSGVYHPDPANVEVYNRILPTFKNLYHDNKRSFAALNSEG